MKKRNIFFGVLITVMSSPLFAKMPKVVFNFSALKADELAVFQDNKYDTIQMVEFEEVKYSQNCFKKGKEPSCLAFEVLKKPESKILAKFEGNPAAQQCVKIGGHNLIGIDNKKHEFDICFFKDKSYGTSWSMYYKLTGRETIQ